MPAFMAHYTCGVLAQNAVFGIHAQKSPDSPAARALAAHPNVYHVGLAGPDLFFYSLYEQSRKAVKIGRVIHKYRTNQFLRALFCEAAALSGDDKAIALAYFTGYVGHYCLDSSTHPFVYRVCEDSDEAVALGKHFRFEAAMDVRITEKYLGRDIDHSHQMGLIRLDRKERGVIADVLARAIRKVYPDYPAHIGELRLRCILLEYMVISSLLLDPTGFKEYLVLSVEKVLRGYSLFSSLCINQHVYGIDQEMFTRFDRRFLRGCRYFETLLPLIDQAVRSPEKQNTLFQAVGSRSYHTGRQEDGAVTEINWA